MCTRLWQWMSIIDRVLNEMKLYLSEFMISYTMSNSISCYDAMYFQAGFGNLVVFSHATHKYSNSLNNYVLKQ